MNLSKEELDEVLNSRVSRLRDIQLDFKYGRIGAKRKFKKQWDIQIQLVNEIIDEVLK